ncbi:MAG: serine/threonine protein kinase [Alcanivoracaceae bacterium]|nr:serine/threonine protein kinase [Alcanivoracaceae bacterium]
MNNTKLHKDFKFLERLIDKHPDLNEQEILSLFQKSKPINNTDEIEIISDSLSDKTGQLLNSALTRSQPEDPQSTAQYEIDKKISTGGQSDVYLAHRSDGTYHKTVIMKVLKHKYTSADDRTAFLNEIQILADLQHPNIVTIIDAGFNKNNEPWMVLEYIQGVHIDEYITQQQLTIKKIISLIIDISEALSYIHQKYIFHLDIKPGNILIKTADGIAQPFLIDFGVSLTHEKTDKTTQNILATPAFASPEQMGHRKEGINQNSDIFSIGKLILALININNKLLINIDLQSIINKCTQNDPSDRYQNIRQLIADLNNYQNRQQVSTRQLNQQQKLWRLFQKRPILHSLLLLMLVSIISLTSHSMLQKHQQGKLLKIQTKHSQYYWGIADDIKNATRFLYLRPSSNIQPELNELKNTFIKLEKKYQQESVEQKQFISLAIAKAAISLGLYQKAQSILNFIHNKSPQDKAVIISLARNYLNLYQQEIQKANQYSDAKIRKAQINILKDRYLIPAQKLFTNQTLNDHQQNIMFKSMLMYFNGEIAGALKQLEKNEKNELWPIPRMLFATDILAEEARKHKVNGNNKLANLLYKKAYNLIENASTIARSHPEIFKKKCKIKTELLITEIDKIDTLNIPELSDCDELIQVLTSDQYAITTAIKSYINLGRAQCSQGQNPQKYLNKAESLLAGVENTSSGMTQTNFILGQTNQIKGKWKMYSNQDSQIEQTKSVDYHRLAAESMPQNYLFQIEFASALYLRATSISPFNQLADVSFEESTQIMLGLLNHADASILLSSRLVEILTNHSYYRYQNSYKADEQLTQASVIATTMQEKWPDNIKVQLARSYVEWTYADYLVYQGKDPEPHLGLAINSYNLIINDQPNSWIFRFNQVSAMLSGVTYYLENQLSQNDQLKLIEHRLAELQKIVSDDVDLSSLYGYYYNMLALNQQINKMDSMPSILASRDYNSQCVKSSVDGYNCLTQFATLLKIEHHRDFLHHSFDTKKWRKDLSIVEKGLIAFPDHHQLLAQRAQLRVLSIQFLKLNKSQQSTQLKLAQIELETVIREQPLLKERYQNDLDNIQQLSL